MIILSMINMGLRFLLELIALVIYGYWGYTVGSTSIGKGILCLLVPLMIAMIWGFFGSPKAKFHLSSGAHLLLELLIFLLPVVLLISIEKVEIDYLYGGIFILNKLLLIYWHS